MNVLDWILVLIAVAAAVSGWRQGLVAGVLSFAGFIAGAIVGAYAAPIVLGDLDGILRFGLTVLIVLAGAGIGNALATFVGTWVRETLSWKPVRFVDSVGGSVFGVLSVIVVAWIVAWAALAVPLGPISTQVRSSQVLSRIDAALPEQARSWVSGLADSLDATGLPQAFAGFSLDPLLPVREPDPALLEDPAVRRAWGSLVKVEGIAQRCGTQVDGSGFVYAADRVMTNAHVVAGVDRPTVQVRGTGRRYPGVVVYLDPEVDVAVIYVPGLSTPTVDFASRQARRGDPAVVAGFPGGGPLTAGAARVRGVVDARGTDIYGRGSVVREIYSLRADVRGGNSGGPLLSPDGDVYGVIFAASVDDPSTGYALTAATVAPAAKAGRSATAAVPTGSCATR
ncbi:MAG: MarP family serine protease [Actinobacteria bacterium]|nr:MarP family serine protease [Actinomycetota bacterium]